MGSFEQAVAFHKQGRLDLAMEHYLKTIDADFDNVDALYLLGTVYLQKHKVGLAAQLYKQVLSIMPGHFEAWNNLGNCYKSINKDEDSKACWAKALSIPDKIDGDYADIFNNLCTLSSPAATARLRAPF